MRNWVLLVEGGVGDPDVWGRELLHYSAFLYADNCLVVSTDPEWLQGAFKTLTGLFNRVGLRTNFCKKGGILFHLQSEAAYE